MKRTWVRVTLICLAVTAAALIAAVMWVKSSLWNQIHSAALEQGVDLQKPEISLRWMGGYRFHLVFQDIKGELKQPLPAFGTFSAALIETTFVLQNQFDRIVIEELTLDRLAGDLTMSSSAEAASTPAKTATDEIALPKIEIPAFERPELPIDISLRKSVLSVTHLKLTLQGVDDGAASTMVTDVRDVKVTAVGFFDRKTSQADIGVSLGQVDVNGTGTGTAPTYSLAGFKGVADVKVRGAAENPRRLIIEASSEASWAGLRFQAAPAQSKAAASKKGSATFALQDEGGDYKLALSPDHVEFRLKGRKLKTSSQKQATDYSVELTPKTLASGSRSFHLNLRAPPLLFLTADIETPATLDLDKPEAKLKAKIKIHPDVSLLILDKNPFPWKSLIEGPIDVEIRKTGQVLFSTDLKGKGLDFKVSADLNTKTQDGEANGFAALNFLGQNMEFAGLKPSGRISTPFKILLRQKRQFYFEAELRFLSFSIAGKDLKVTSLQGSLPVKQSWRFQDQRWQLSPKLQPNAFARVDFESFEPLDTHTNQLRIGRVEWQKKIYGPVVMDLRFEQNIFRSGAWNAKVGEGSIEGALQADISVEQPRLGLLLRGFDVKMDDLFPESLFRSKVASAQGLSFRLGMDWDLGNATAVGRLDWSSITSEQVMQVLDFLDPQFEDATFNQARMILAQAHPTRVQVEMRGPVADIRIQTNLIALPEVRNLALSPYLAKVSESLYASEVFQSLRPRTNTKTPPIPRRDPRRTHAN